MKNFRFVRFWGLLIALFFAVTSSLSAATYYAKLTLQVGQGQGKVFVSASSTQSPSYANTSTATNSANNYSLFNNNSANVSFYLYAQAENGYAFEGWYSDENLNNRVSTANGSTYSFSASSKNNNSPTPKTLYAKFIPLYSYTATLNVAVASNSTGGGTVSVNNGTQSLQNTTETSRTFTFSLNATANASEGYTFEGWSEKADGSSIIANSKVAPFSRSITCTSSAPKQSVTYYAVFKKHTYYSECVAYVGEGGKVGVSTTSDVVVEGAISSRTKNTVSTTGSAQHTYYVKCEAEAGYEFKGWYSNNSYTGTALSTEPITGIPVGVSSENAADPTLFNIYAKVVPVYSATVNVVGDGGVAKVNGTVGTVTQTYEVGSTTSKNFSFTLTVEENDGYTFKGWARSLEGEIVSTEKTRTVTLTCTSGNRIKEETWYAICEKEGTADNTFINPILTADAIEPSVILAEDGFAYMYCSEKTIGEGISIWRSADMLNWTKIGSVFGTRPANVSDSYALTAPEIAFVNGKYVLYYSNVYGTYTDYLDWFKTKQKSQICVATSNYPYGPFENNKVLIRSYDNDVSGSKNVGKDCYDPSFFQDGSNNYLVWGKNSGIWRIKLNSNGTSVSGDVLDVIDRGNITGIDDGDFNKLSAPRLLKHNDVYYLMATKGEAVVVARAKTALNDTKGSNFVNEDGDNSFGADDIGSLLQEHRTYELFKNRSYVVQPGHTSQFVVDKNGQAYVYYHGYTKDDTNKTTKKLFADMIVWKVQGTGGKEWPTIFDPDVEHVQPTKPEVNETPQIASSRQISNASELMKFANDTQSNSLINAVITADIDCSSITNWTPVGSTSYPYKGVINGQNHKITNLNVDKNANNVALVGVAGSGATIKNLIIDSSCSFKGTNYVAAFVANVNEANSMVRFDNCGNDASVTGTDNVAAFFAGDSTNVNRVEINVCYNAGTLNGTSGAVFSASESGSAIITNSWNSGTHNFGTTGNTLARVTGTVKNSFDLTTSSTYGYNKISNYSVSWITNGHLAYYINEKNNNVTVWYQKLGIDDHPMPFTRNNGDEVYKAIGCNGAHLTTGGYNDGGYTNSSRGASHAYEFALSSTELSRKCKNCHAPSSIIVPRNSVDKYLEVSDADQLEMTMDFISQGKDAAKAAGNEVGNNSFGIDVNIRLMQDIDFRSKGNKCYGLSTNGKRFVSIFDGQFHHVNVNYTTNRKYFGLFSSLNGATIKSLYVDGTITNEKFDNLGSIFGVAFNSTIEKCISSVSIIDKRNSEYDSYIGGVGGLAQKNTVINNCGFVGSISASSAKQVSGIVGLQEDVKVTIKNSYVAADISAKGNNEFATEFNSVVVNNCYRYSPDATKVTNGQLCYDLNNGQTSKVWKQTIGVQPYPDFIGDDVVLEEESREFCNVFTKENLSEGKFFTVCIPWNSVKVEGAEIYSIAGKRLNSDRSNLKLMLSGTEDNSIAAGIPYICRATGDVFEVYHNSIPVKKPHDGYVNGMVGKFENFLFADWVEGENEPYGYSYWNDHGGVYVIKNNEVRRAGSTSGVNAYGAFIIGDLIPIYDSANSVRTFVCFEGMNDDDETSVDDMVVVENSNDIKVYNLQGQRVYNLSRGIYIVNGKKVFVK